MKRYEGNRRNGLTDVRVNGAPLNPRLDLRKHSLTGFEWGYGGSGPTQLALAILADCVGDELALQHYQEFKRAVIESLPRRRWTLLEEQIQETVKASSSLLPASVPPGHNHPEKRVMKLSESLEQITPLPWYFREMDNDKVIPTVRIFGRRKRDPSKGICFGRIDTARDARYACHAANALPEAASALRLLLEDQKRAKSELSRAQFEFCESALAKAETIQPENMSAEELKELTGGIL